MSEYRAITITQGSGGFGGPLTVEPKEGKDVLLYITGGGAEPDILPKIVELTGCRPVNGFKTSVPEEEIFLVIIDCGGTLRCGIYPQKRIPTININPVGKSGPMAKYITEDIYVSGVKNDNIALADGSASASPSPTGTKSQAHCVLIANNAGSARLVQCFLYQFLHRSMFRRSEQLQLQVQADSLRME